MNEPTMSQRANNKLLQLKLASEIGFDVPPTIVSNHPPTIRAFIAQGPTISKPLSGSRVSAGQVLYTSVLPNAKSIRDEELSVCPSIYQMKIDKRYDLRVTVVGRKVFATRILGSNENVDWRALPDSVLSYEPHTLPDALTEKCLTMLTNLELSYGALDMIVDTNGNYRFLELNPSGQWGWIERTTAQPITKAIIDTLCER